MLDELDAGALAPDVAAGLELVAAGIAMRRIARNRPRDALCNALQTRPRASEMLALKAEVERAMQALEAPAARLVARGGERLLRLEDVEALIASDALIVDACRNVVRAEQRPIPLASRPVLLALMRFARRSLAGRCVPGRRFLSVPFEHGMPMNLIARDCGSRSGACAKRSVRWRR